MSKHFYNQNNLPKDIEDQIQQLLSLNHWSIYQDSFQERQANKLTLIRRNIDIVPEYDPLQHRAIAHVQRARVVGLSRRVDTQPCETSGYLQRDVSEIELLPTSLIGRLLLKKGPA